MSALRDRLAEYVSHKHVRAGEICDCGSPTDPRTVRVIYANGELSEWICLTQEQWDRGGHQPMPGDRIVVYGEGRDEYLSIAPKKAFEEGYRLLSDVAGEQQRLFHEEALTDHQGEVPRAEHHLNGIGWAVAQMKTGAKVTRNVPDWTGWYVALFEGVVTIFDTASGTITPFTFGDEEILALDWVPAP